MVRSATAPVRHDHQSPRFVFLHPAHLRLYDCHTATTAISPFPSLRSKITPKPTSPNDAASPNPRCGVGGGIGESMLVRTETSLGRLGGSTSTTGGASSSSRSTGLGLQQQPQRHRERPSGIPARRNGSFGTTKRRNLPLAPMAMSARCQVHPMVMQDMGMCPGDPVLVLTLAEGWASQLVGTAAPTLSGLSCIDGEETGQTGGNGAADIAEVSKPAGGNESHQGATAAVDLKGRCCLDRGDIVVKDDDFRGSVPRNDGTGGNNDHLDRKTFESFSGDNATMTGAAVAGEGKTGALPRGMDGSALEAREKGEQSDQQFEAREKFLTQHLADNAAHEGEGQHRLNALAKGMAKLKCFLCTVWTNPHLGHRETAVDGRVNVPLSSKDTAAMIPSQHHAALSPSVMATGNAKYTADSTPSSSDSVVPTLGQSAAERLIARFLNSAIDQHLTETGARLENGNGGGDPVVCIIPVQALSDGCGTGDGDRAGYNGEAPSLAGRISAQVFLPPTCNGSQALVGAEPVAGVVGVTATSAAQLGSRRAVNESSPPPLPPSAGDGTWVLEKQQQQERQEQRKQNLAPEYTSLVKRSLRHLVVSDGCEIAVPYSGGNGGARAMVDGAAAESVVGDSWSGKNHRGGHSGSPGVNDLHNLRQEDGTAVVRITIGGGGCNHRLEVGGALSALMSGPVVAIGPDSIMLVESGASERVRGAAGVHPGVAATERRDQRIHERKGASISEERARAFPGRHDRRMGKDDPATFNKMTPTEALVELMLLPMTPHPHSQNSIRDAGDVRPLEFLVPRGVLLTGPPGVGKTFAVRSAVDAVRNTRVWGGEDEAHFQVQLTTLNGSEILSLGQWEACKALREAFSSAENWSKGGFEDGDGERRNCSGGFLGARQPLRNRCAVIFLDEADALLARRDREGDKAAGGEGARALAQLLTLMDGFHGAAEGSSHVVVVGATNRPGALDPALRRPGRFDQEIALSPPDAQGRLTILRHHLRGVEVEGGEETIEAVAIKCVGYVGADLAALAREAALAAARAVAARSNAHREGDRDTAATAGTTAAVGVAGLEDLYSAMEKVGASSLRGHQVSVPNTPWSDIGGMEEAKAKLRQAVEWPAANKAAFDRMGLTPPRGILLFGPPGCSKTTLVRAAATAAGATFVCLSGADVFSPYLGEAEAAVRQAFRIARNAAPALLFFDEIDAIVCMRGGGSKGSANSAESRVLATFLTEMDGVGSLKGDGVVVVGATNRPEAVDRALLRPGRFDQVVYAPLPNEEARQQIFEVHTRKMVVDREKVDFLKLSRVTSGLTGAEIEGICREAAMSAIREAGFGDDGENHPNQCTATTEQGGNETKKTTRGAIVAMRHLMAAAKDSAAHPGVTQDMMKSYDRFASGVR